MATFYDFRDGSGGRVLRTLGRDISGLETWSEYTRSMLEMPDNEHKQFLERVRQFASECSSSQHGLIGAVLQAADYAWLADELGAGEFWRRVSNFDRNTATTVAAAILRVDS